MTWCPVSPLLVNIYGQTETSDNGACSILVPCQIKTIKQRSFVCLNGISYYTWKQVPTTSTTLEEEEVQFYFYIKWVILEGKQMMGHNISLSTKWNYYL